MAYDRDTAMRIREALGSRDDVMEKPMFGCLAFMLHGHLAVGATANGIMVRCALDDTSTHLAQGAGPFQMHGKQPRGWLLLDESQLSDDDEFARWVAVGVEYADSQPPK